MGTPTITDTETIEALGRLSRAMDHFPAIVMPNNKVDVRSSIAGGVDLPSLIRGMAHDLEHIAAGNKDMHERAGEDKAAHANLRRDVAAMRRVLGTEPAEV